MLQEKHGWYVAAPLERIKNILRHKFFALLEGYQATDEECLLIGNEKEEKTIPTTKSIKTSWSKHNRAKGAQRPEELAVCDPHSDRWVKVLIFLVIQAVRLRAALQKKEPTGSGPS